MALVPFTPRATRLLRDTPLFIFASKCRMHHASPLLFLCRNGARNCDEIMHHFCTNCAHFTTFSWRKHFRLHFFSAPRPEIVN